MGGLTIVAKVQLVITAMKLSVGSHHDLTNAIRAAALFSRLYLVLGQPSNYAVADVRSDLSRPGKSSRNR